MIIVADQNIPHAARVFSGMGEVRLLPGRGIAPETVREADVLLIRSVTRIDADFLAAAGTRLRFLGTATAGVDHVDAAALAGRGIHFASAPGHNARSVAEWTLAAILEWAAGESLGLIGLTLGVVGGGAVGSLVAAMGRALGMRTLVCDPPLRRVGACPDGAAFSSLPELLESADIVTLHVPLTASGPDRTADMAGAAFFGRMRPGSLFINSSRGAVVDEKALCAGLRRGKPGFAILDVWRDEPGIRRKTLDAAYLATPHIAGYSLDGKTAGTTALFRSACRFFGRDSAEPPGSLLPPPEVPDIDLSDWAHSDSGAGQPISGDAGGALAAPEWMAAWTEDAIRLAVRHAYDIRRDDAAMNQLLEKGAPPGMAARIFDDLRAQYPPRREFGAYRVVNAPPEAHSALLALGFKCPSPAP